VYPNGFSNLAKERLLKLLKPNIHTYSSSDLRESTWIFPLLQMGPLGIIHDEIITSYLLRSVQPGSICYISSPYFNLTQRYAKLILNGTGNIEIITADPKANGFFTASDISGGIPAAYTMVEKQFYAKVKTANQTHRVKILEWLIPNWTYHAKGLWYSIDNASKPNLSLIGSSNLGVRSATRDIELQLLIVTENPTVMDKLDQERKALFSSTVAVADDTLFKKPERAVPWYIALISELVSQFL